MKPALWLISIALAVATAARGEDTAEQQKYGAALADEVRATRVCIFGEVDRRLHAGQTEISEEDRSTIRTAAANACYDHAVQLARFSSDYRAGTRTLQDITVEMLAQNIAIANALITVRLGQSAKKAALDKSHK